MSVVVRCAKCSRQFAAPDETQGWTVPCPGCGASISVPSAPSRGTRAVAELLADEEQKTRQAQPQAAVNERMVSALGIKQRVGTPAPPGTTLGPPLASRKQTGPLDYLLGHKLVITTILLGGVILVFSLTRSNSTAAVTGVVMGVIGVVFALGAWRSQSLERLQTREAEGWRVVEKWTGAAFGILVFGFFTYGCGRWMYLIASAMAEYGVTQNGMKWFGIFLAIWLAVTGYCIFMLRMSQQYGFFKSAAWSYLGYWALSVAAVWYLATPNRPVILGEIDRRPAPGWEQPSTPEYRPTGPVYRSESGGDKPAPANSRLSGPALPNERPRGSSSPPGKAFSGKKGDLEAGNFGADVVYQQLGVDEENPFNGPPRRRPLVPWTTTIDAPTATAAAGTGRQVAIPFSHWSKVALSRTPGGFVGVYNEDKSDKASSGWQVWDLSKSRTVGQISGAGGLREPFLLSDDGKYLAGTNNETIEVWSTETGKRVASAPAHSKFHSAWIGFVQGPAILVADNAGDAASFRREVRRQQRMDGAAKSPDDGAPNEFRIWNLDGKGQPITVTLPELCDIGSAAAISPGGRYFAFAQENKIWLWDLREGKLSGRLVMFGDGLTLRDGSIGFSPDGTRLAAVAEGGFDKLQLTVWSMADGYEIARITLPKVETALGRDIPSLQFAPDGTFLLARGNTIVDCNSWTPMPLSLKAERGPFASLRVLGLADSSRLLLASDEMIATWRLPRDDGGRITAARLVVAKDELPPGMFAEEHSSTVPFWQARFGEPLEKSSRDYLRTARLATLSGEDEDIAGALGWYPQGKRPALGLRLGLGIQVPGATAISELSSRELEKMLGQLGLDLVKELDNRVASGKCGSWPQTGDEDVRKVVKLGFGPRADLLASAKRAGLDLLVYLEVTQGSGGSRRVDYLLKATICDMGGNTLWTSATLSKDKTDAAKEKGQDLAGGFVSDLMKELEEHYALQSMPELKPEVVKRRMAQLTGKKPTDLMTAIAEVRFYHAKKLLSDDETMLALQNWVELDEAQALTSGDRKARRAALEKSLQNSGL